MITYYPFQFDGALFLYDKKYALLADEMGLGKTPQAILASIDLKRILVISPACGRINWQREFIKFANKDSFILGIDIDKRRSKALSTSPHICSYEYATKNVEQLIQYNWDLIILDEIQLLKEATSKRAVAILGKAGLLHHTKRVWCLSGTPAPNHAGELWIMLYTFGLIKLSYEDYIKRYCKAYQVALYGRMQITGTNLKTINELAPILDKFMLRRKKKDVLKDLPPISHNVYPIQDIFDPLSDAPELKMKMREELALLKEKLNFDLFNPSDEKLLDVLSLMGQSVTSLRRYHGLKKAKTAVKIVKEELDLGLYDKIIIFAIHQDVIKILKYSLREFSPVVFVGSTTNKNRQLAIDLFQEDPRVKIFIGNIQAAGTAIALTAANQVLFVEMDWVPGNNAQASERPHRIGQTLPVTVRYLALAGFDEKIIATLMRKAKEISSFIY